MEVLFNYKRTVEDFGECGRKASNPYVGCVAPISAQCRHITAHVCQPPVSDGQVQLSLRLGLRGFHLPWQMQGPRSPRPLWRRVLPVGLRGLLACHVQDSRPRAP